MVVKLFPSWHFSIFCFFYFQLIIVCFRKTSEIQKLIKNFAGANWRIRKKLWTTLSQQPPGRKVPGNRTSYLLQIYNCTKYTWLWNANGSTKFQFFVCFYVILINCNNCRQTEFIYLSSYRKPIYEKYKWIINHCFCKSLWHETW